MRITTKTDYAVIILTALARRTETPVSLESIAGTAGVSEAYLQRLAARLKRQRLIKAKRGAHGGYFLARPADKISMADIITAVGDSFLTVACAGTGGIKCAYHDRCPNIAGWTKLQEEVSSVFKKYTVANLISYDRPAKTGSGESR